MFIFVKVIIASLSSENTRSRDKENFTQNELGKYKSMLSHLEKEKANLENQLKDLEENINQNEILMNSQTPDSKQNSLVSSVSQLKHSHSSADLVNGNIGP